MNARPDHPNRRGSHASSGKSVSELESHLGYWLRFVSNHVAQAFQRKMEAADVTVSEWVVMREMHRLGPTSPTELGQKIGMTKGAISKLVARLERKELLIRSITEADRRNHVIELTIAGQTLVPALARLADQNDEEFFGHLSKPVRDQLVSAMKEVVRLHQLKAVPID
ncbi:MarR family winged helix-turn-helix transcriptional regulator [Methylocapsa sp. S129]|uniref:MarR family winged helix-turn-helix transcriptional regulator n=1 Tax=Methylocapsa sp. S129 TaxID=1641869 RepID=UPI00131B2EBF|nr:MarR family transcriptional regulator [Methylocapsa sp. S129]